MQSDKQPKGIPLMMHSDFQIRKNIILIREVNLFEDNKEDLKRKQIAKIKNNTNIFKEQTKEQFLSDDFVKSSRIYKALEQQIAAAALKHSQEMDRLKEGEQKKIKDIESTNKKSHHIKLQIWELKNQILQLQNLLNFEEQEYRYLVNEDNQEQYKQNEEQEQYEEQAGSQIQYYEQQPE